MSSQPGTDELGQLLPSGGEAASGSAPFDGTVLNDEHLRLTEALADIDTVIAAPISTDEMRDRVIDMACTALRCESACMLMRGADGWSLVRHRGSAVTEEWCVADEAGALVEAAGAGSVAFISPETEESPLARALAARGVRSAVAAPLAVRGEVTGAILFQYHSAPTLFTPDRLDFIRKLSVTLSLRIESARLFSAEESARRRVQEELEATENLLAAADGLSSLDREVVLQTLGDSVLRSTGCDRVMLMTHDAERGEVRVKGGLSRRPLHDASRMTVDDLSPELRSIFDEPRTSMIDYGDPALAGRLQEHVRGKGVSRVLVVPLMVLDRIVGLVAVGDSTGMHQFGGREVMMIESMAAQAAVALENVRLYEEAKEAALLGDALNEIAAEINASPDLRATVGTIVERAAQALRAAPGTVRLIEGEPGGGIVPVPRASSREIAVPLFIGDDVFGTLLLAAAEDAPAFSRRQADFARKLGAQLSLALANERLLLRERASVRLAEALNRVNEVLLAAVDVDDMLAKIVAETTEAIGADKALLALASAEGWTVRAVQALDATLEGQPVPGGCTSVLDGAAHARAPQLIDHVSTECGSEFALANGIASSIVLPLVAQDEVLGVVYFAYTQRRSFDAADTRFADRLSTALSLALDRARVQEEQREAARLNEAIAAIDGTIHSTLQSEEIVRRALSAGGDAIGAETGAILMHEDGTSRVAYAYGTGTVPSLWDDPHSEAAHAVRSGKTFVADDVALEPRREEGVPVRLDMCSVIVAPLVVRGEIVASLQYGYVTSRHEFSRAERDFVTKLALSVSIALENAQAYASEHRVAQTLQEALLALPVEVPGVDAAHEYHSASNSARVGGDFYDIFELQHGLLGLVVGDVSGKGLDAAVLTALVKNTIRAHAVRPGNPPSFVMKCVNDVLLKESRPETFVTGFFGILDRRDGRFVYCSAGHPAALVVRQDGHAVKLTNNSPIAGAFAAARFVDSETWLDVDDLLFLYTDGLTEARRSGEMYGEQRLFVQLATAGDTEPKAAIDRVMADVTSFTGGPLSDDVAVLAVRRLALPGETPVQQKLPLWGDSTKTTTRRRRHG